jgi:RNA polymerase sigma-70 factor (ECF subfamily)
MGKNSTLSATEFEEQALPYLGALLSVATRFTRNRTEAEDLVQDTFVKAMRARHQFQAGTNLKGWMFRILTNTFINKYRRGGLERSVLDGAQAEPLTDRWISAATLRSMRDPESLALRPRLEAEIGRALDELPEDFRVAVMLADVEELSYQEIADSVGCPVGTVMSRLHRGRRLLKTKLVDQARAMGIIPEPKAGAGAETGIEAPVPVDLQAFRRSKEQSA